MRRNLTIELLKPSQSTTRTKVKVLNRLSRGAAPSVYNFFKERLYILLNWAQYG
jgi:hypothetical protein